LIHFYKRLPFLEVGEVHFFIFLPFFVMSCQKNQVEASDPFPSTFDPNAKPFDPTNTDKQCNADPPCPNKNNATPKSKDDLSSWQVVAAEFSGKAVAVMLTPDSSLLVCTSPSFNSKCTHSGLACYDWDTALQEKDKTSEPALESLHDSGVDNLTDEMEKNNRVAKWSAEASRHAKEWSADGTCYTMGWTDDLTSPVWSETAPTDCSNIWPGAYTEQFPTEGYHITVEYHDTIDNGYDYQYEPMVASDVGHSPRVSGFGNDPLVVYQAWDNSQCCTEDFARLGLEHEVPPSSVSVGDEENSGKEIKEAFRKQVWSNLQKDVSRSTDNDICDALKE